MEPTEREGHAHRPSQPPLKRRARSAWRAVLRLNRAQDGLNRASGGALFFNTGVKILAYAGFCLIVFILIQKVRQIEAQLDPVAQGFAQLQKELSQAQTDVGRDTEASQQELLTLQARARTLEETLDRASAQHKKVGAKSLQDADREAQELADMLARDQTASKAIAAQREAVAQALSDYAAGLQLARAQLAGQAAGLADGGAGAQGALADLSSRLRAQSALLDRDQLGAALDRVTAQADALAAQEAGLGQRLSALSQRLGKLESELPAAIPRAPARAPEPPVAAARVAREKRVAAEH